MKYVFAILAFALACPTLAAQSLPTSEVTETRHKVFMSSKNQLNEGFDVWQIDSGYSYSLFESVDLYVGTRVKNSQLEADKGFLSGISYQFNDKISVNSSLYKGDHNELQTDSGLGAEVSGSFEVSEGLNLHATLEHDEWQQGITFGLGYNF